MTTRCHPPERGLRLDQGVAYPRAVIEPVTGLAGDLLRFRLRDPGDGGPWALRIDWGDGTVNTPSAREAGTLSFLREESYTTPGTYVITVTATDSRGATSTNTASNIHTAAGMARHAHRRRAAFKESRNSVGFAIAVGVFKSANTVFWWSVVIGRSKMRVAFDA